MRSIAAIVLSLLLPLQSLAHSGNVILNGDFENGLDAWRWGVNHTAQATGRLDEQGAYTGKYGFRITNASPYAPHVFGMLCQSVKVKPDTKYRISLWAKGTNVGLVWFGGGPKWDFRNHFPKGTFDWQSLTTEYTTGKDETDFFFLINVETPTGAAWVDNIEMVPTPVTDQREIYPPRVLRELPASVRAYPVLPADKKDLAPVVKIRALDDAQKPFGADFKAAWTPDAIIFDIEILDPTPGPVSVGADMYNRDSIQLALDTNPDQGKAGYNEFCYELGFSPQPDGTIAHASWQAGGKGQFDWDGVNGAARRTQTGYSLHIEIPWKNLNLDPTRLPPGLGMNLLVNDGNEHEGRRYVEWTPATGSGVKLPNEFTRLFLTKPSQSQTAVGFFSFARPFTTKYDPEEMITGRYIEYALASLPEESLRLMAVASDAKVFNWFDSTLPKIPARSFRDVLFSIPARELPKEGVYTLTSPGRGTVAINRVNLLTQIAEKLKLEKAHFEKVKNRLAGHPQLAADPYIHMGLVLAERFIKTAETGGPDGKQTLTFFKPSPPDIDRQARLWSWLQINEVEKVLLWTSDIIDQRLKAGGKPVVLSWPTGRRLTIRDGVFFDGDRPSYFLGYNGWGKVNEDIPVFHDYGVTAVEQEAGPCEAKPDGTLTDRGNQAPGILEKGAKAGVLIDYLLAPHYFPGDLMQKFPDLDPAKKDGFIAYVIDHPEARKQIERWLKGVTPLVKDKPGLLMFNLSNEPLYLNSGRDVYSRPKWIAYLKQHHQTIENLNKFYGTAYKTFDQVGVPEIGMPDKIEARRAYWDWCRFNQLNFADWHRWMSEMIKHIDPSILTSAKVMLGTGDWTLARSHVHQGVDPELFCEFTDIANCDNYYYNFAFAYDLLHAFGRKPVFNSETHLIADGSAPDSINSDYIRSSLWQGFLHHCGGSIIWVWDVANFPGLVGSIYFRPANLFAAGRAGLDAIRFAPELTAINREKPAVALLYSMPSIFWQDNYGQTLIKFYDLLNQMGRPITFVSERQLAAGISPNVDFIVIPQATHVGQTTLTALQKYIRTGGKLILIGTDCLAFDEYHRKHFLPQEFSKALIVDLAGTALRKTLTDHGFKIIDLIDLETNKPAAGLEYRIVREQRRTLIPVTNLLAKPKTIRLDLKGSAVDLLTGQAVDLHKLSLEPLKPRLIEVR